MNARVLGLAMLGLGLMVGWWCSWPPPATSQPPGKGVKGTTTTTTGSPTTSGFATTTTGGGNGDTPKPAGIFRPAGPKDVAIKPQSLNGIIKGRAVYDGTPPERVVLDAIKDPKNKVCRDAPEEQQINQTWLVNPDMANVLVLLQPPPGHYFPFDREKMAFKKDVTLDQPHCAFIPHVSVVFPVYWDGEKKEAMKTGQTFTVLNSAPVVHNAKMEGEGFPGHNPLIQPKGRYPVEFEKASRSPVMLSCAIHPWMSGYIWVLDHPYAAVTDRDGNFEIKGVPTGVELTVAAWHEGKPHNGRTAFFTQAVKLTKNAPEKQVEIKVTK